ncbi:MAG TPA: class I SAM-dependent methyltransferase [Syntrophobacteraceae bacterium]|nr:class I SAM-dependent methyltransferase [Syntrophobacteraceae bacterium]
MDFKNTISTIKDIYDRLVEQHGDSLISVQRPKGRQDIIFDALMGITNSREFSFLDVGCGVGHLLEYFIKNESKVKYTGIDVSLKMIEICRNKFSGNEDTYFHSCNLFELPGLNAFDYVGLSGTLNNNPEQLPYQKYLSYVTHTIDHMFRLCRVGISFNLMTTYVDYQTPGAFYANPVDIIEFVRTLTRRFVLRCDYMPYEFTVYAYKDQEIIRPDNIYHRV